MHARCCLKTYLFNTRDIYQKDPSNGVGNHVGFAQYSGNPATRNPRGFPTGNEQCINFQYVPPLHCFSDAYTSAGFL